MSFFRYACITALVISVGTDVFAFEMDRGIGFERGRDIEDWMDVGEARTAAAGNGGYAEFTGLGAYNVSATAGAHGNSIFIKTDPGSHVTLSATQINSGNQTVEINLKNVTDNRYQNVEVTDVSEDSSNYNNRATIE